MSEKPTVDSVKEFIDKLDIPKPFDISVDDDHIECVWPDYLLQMGVCFDLKVFCTSKKRGIRSLASFDWDTKGPLETYLKYILAPIPEGTPIGKRYLYMYEYDHEVAEPITLEMYYVDTDEDIANIIHASLGWRLEKPIPTKELILLLDQHTFVGVWTYQKQNDHIIFSSGWTYNDTECEIISHKLSIRDSYWNRKYCDWLDLEMEVQVNDDGTITVTKQEEDDK